MDGMDFSGLACVCSLLERRFDRFRGTFRVSGLASLGITGAGFALEEPVLWLAGLAAVAFVVMSVAVAQCVQMQEHWNRGDMEPVMLSRIDPAAVVDAHLVHNLRNTTPWLASVALMTLAALPQALSPGLVYLVLALLVLLLCSSLFVVAYRLAAQVAPPAHHRRILWECAMPAIVLGVSCLADSGAHAPASFFLASAGAGLGVAAARWWTVACLTRVKPSTSALDGIFPLLLAVPFGVMAFSAVTREETAAGLVLGGVVVAGCLGVRSCLCCLRGRVCPQELCLAGAPAATLLAWMLAGLQGHAAAPALLLVALSLCAPLWGALAGVYLSEVKAWTRAWRAGGLVTATLAATWLVTISLTVWALAP